MPPCTHLSLWGIFFTERMCFGGGQDKRAVYSAVYIICFSKFLKNMKGENKMKKKTVALLLALVMVFGAAVGGTIAYLTSNDSVTNTFTVGKVAITLDETDVDVYGVKDGETRVKTNEYKLIPGHEYTKDPIVHFAAKSEASWLFVKVDDGLANIEADTKIAAQIVAKGWTALNGVDGVFHFLGGVHGFFGQFAHLVGHNGESASGLTGAGGLDGGVQGKQVGLVGHLVDHAHHLADIACLLAQSIHCCLEAQHGVVDSLDCQYSAPAFLRS